MSQSRKFVFTCNNYTEGDIGWFQNEAHHHFQYWCFGREVAPTTLTPHLQGVIIFERTANKKSASQVAAVLRQHVSNCHVEIMKGRSDQAIEYTKKEGDWYEGGIPPPGQGKRTDLAVVVEAIENGDATTMQDIAIQFPTQLIKFSKGLQTLITLRTAPRNFKTEIFWLHGATGSGKSHFAWMTEPTAYPKGSTTKWWCGYQGEEAVILDDFRPSKELPFNYILALFDRYPMTVEYKGGTCQFISKRIYVTSPYSPMEMMNHMEWIGTEHKEQLMRRIEHVIAFPQLGTTMMN
ncbi:RNA helicase domain-containing protein [Shewanella sp.]|uniref:RNA helicase domain-containing protein n=1 Tax=Shewanella sp. TaxID=50422 RepID=UPI004047B39C